MTTNLAVKELGTACPHGSISGVRLSPSLLGRANGFSFKVLSRWQTEMDLSIRGDQLARWSGLLPDQLEPGPVAVEVAVGVEVGVAGHHVFVGPVQPGVIVLVAEL